MTDGASTGSAADVTSGAPASAKGSLDVATTRPILAGAFLRAVATGMAGVLLGLHLARLGHGDTATIEATSSLGLWGVVLTAAVATFWGERTGRRRLLFVVTSLAAIGGLWFALGSSVFVLGTAALVGAVNAMGRDRGGASILEQSLLAESVEPRRRTFLFARYNVAQDAGRAIGGLLAATPKLWQTSFGDVASMRMGMATPAFLFVVAAVVALRIPARVDAKHGRTWSTKLSPESRPIVVRLSALFFVDSFGGGLLTTSFITWWFATKFHVDEGALGPLNAAACVLNAVSHFGAAWLAKRIGLVNTMVFTHLPSSLLFIGAAYAPTFWIAAALYLLREGLAEMDVPTRQSYVLAIVKPQERTVVAGLTTLVRMVAWAAAPAFAAARAGHFGLEAPLLVGSSLKIAYDLLLWRACRHVRPPEEQ